MSKDVKFYLEQSGVSEVVYRSGKLKNVEREVMERELSEIKATFLQEFGFEGSFILEFTYAKVGGKGAGYVNGVRPTYRIRAADARTGAILKKNPGWLGRFSKNAKL